MECPRCGSTQILKNGKKHGKQNHICRACKRQFIDLYDPPRGYPEHMKQVCRDLYADGLGFRTIGRLTGINHSTIRHWVTQMGDSLSQVVESQDSPAPEA
ncbi:MAG: hypothetical protein ACKO7W_12190 [Elainella sp.]